MNVDRRPCPKCDRRVLIRQFDEEKRFAGWRCGLCTFALLIVRPVTVAPRVRKKALQESLRERAAAYFAAHQDQRDPLK